jgi:hypothetical protein
MSDISVVFESVDILIELQDIAELSQNLTLSSFRTFLLEKTNKI